MRYSILGCSEVWADDAHAVPLGGLRLRALTAALALRPGRPVPVPALVDDVWADEPPEDAPAALQALVARLRRALGREAITSIPGGYRLEATQDDVDLFRFERLAREGAAALEQGDPKAAADTLRAALALWRGPALADLPDGAAAAARAEAHRLTAVRHRVAADLALGRAAEVVPELWELVAAHPLDEPFHAQLIRALRATGRYADALAAYEGARRILADRLGADPGRELLVLHRELLSVEGENPATPTAPTSTPEPTTATPPTPPGNLRTRLTSFVGREADLATLRHELSTARLVTLTGPGGSGKTRLAEEAAAAMTAARGHANAHPRTDARHTAGSPNTADSPHTNAPDPDTPYPDGAWIAELAPLDDPSAVPGAVLSALGGRTTTLRASGLEGRVGEVPTERLVEHCAHRRLLLVLDNCEHVIGAAAGLAETLLARCPGVTVLATSREPLGVPGEAVRPVEPLAPAPAHRLFAERAAAVRPGFDPSAVPGTEAAVAEICRRLDGLPLAIELAAARLRLLTPRQIAERLDDRFRLLTSGSRTVLPRQQTLVAVVDWSWDLLDERERTVLRRASVFAGGWDLTAAEAVCADDKPSDDNPAEGRPVQHNPPKDNPPEDGPAQHEPTDTPPITPADVLPLLGALVDKSLVEVDHTPAGDTRYRMLETIHEYATDRAAAHPADRDTTVRRHTAYVLAFVREAAPRLRSADQLPWLRCVETELDNIRAALHHTIAAGDEGTALELVRAMGWFWWLRNYRDEGAAWVDRVTAFGPIPDDEDHPHYWHRVDLRMLHSFLRADQLTAEEVRSPEGIAGALRILEAYDRPGPAPAHFPGLVWPILAYFAEGLEGVVPRLDRAVANCRAYGGDWEVCAALMFRTYILMDTPGGIARADAARPELRELSRRVGDRWLLAQLEGAHGEVTLMRGGFQEARAAFEEALRLCDELGASNERPFLLLRLAQVAYEEGDDEAARELSRHAREEGERYGVRDTQAFGLFLLALIALRREDVAGARELCEQARAAAENATPPAQLRVALTGLTARIEGEGMERDTPEGRRTLRESLRGLTLALRQGLAAHSAGLLLAVQVQWAAGPLAALGHHEAAARLLGAADAWRESLPRNVPEREHVARLSARARAALGPGAYERSRAEGRALTPEQALALLESYSSQVN
ncbi:BTAD domain-containing putative transcriptional regulator [Streptomyces pathocidini]|uniref:BTAD domain-containing putative transcriptional regulator n=1 Tax=Streptomyces pathocidini TaxID=1650571 RepID=UPI0033D32B82